MSEDRIVTLSVEVYDKLIERSDWLDYLEQAGVDNWEGISYARQLQQEDEEEGKNELE